MTTAASMQAHEQILKSIKASTRSSEPLAERIAKCALRIYEPRRHSTYIKVFLHPEDVDIAVAEAPTEDMAAAWLEGKAVPGRRNRVKLVPRNKYREERHIDMQGLHDEGREWWEQSCGGSCGGG